MNVLYALIPALLLILGLGGVVAWAQWQKRRYEAKRRSPLTAKLLRAPGGSIREELEELGVDMDGWLMIAAVGPVTVFAIHLAQSYLGGISESPLRVIVTAFSALALVVISTVKIQGLQARRRQLRCGMEAELAVGQELDQLMRRGAVVFHDFPAEGFNIDHVVVAKSGVFAVETKGRTKTISNRGKNEATVSYDGKVLQFPDWVEREPIEQARRQAKWLAKWLTSAVGEKVHVKPVVALPGWFVERLARNDVTVINGKEAHILLKGEPGVTLADSLVGRIAHQLEQRCRDVEPAFYRKGRRERSNST